MKYKADINEIDKCKQRLCQKIFDNEILPYCKRFDWVLCVGMGSAFFCRRNGDTVENKTTNRIDEKVCDIAEAGSLMENGFYHGMWWVCSAVEIPSHYNQLNN